MFIEDTGSLEMTVQAMKTNDWQSPIGILFTDFDPSTAGRETVEAFLLLPAHILPSLLMF